MRNKTIVYVGEFSLPDKSASANRVVSNGKIFNILGYDTVFLGAAPESDEFEGIRKSECQNNMYERAHPKSTKQWINHTFNVNQIVSFISEINNVSMVILYNLPFITLLLLKFALYKSNIKVCYDCTEWCSYTEGSFLKRVFKAIDEFFIRNFTHKIADKMIVISKMMADKYKNTDIIVVPPLVDTNDKIWHQENNDNKEIFEFCFSGSPGGNKESLDLIVEAFKKLNKRNTKLRIVGITKQEFQQFYPKCVLSEQSDELIIFTGKVSHEKSVYYIKNCDCYIFIRISDRRNNAGFPTKFAESYTCNVPIITTNVSDVSDYKNEKICIIDDLKEENILNAMISQVKNKTEQNNCLNNDFHYESYIKIFENWLNK